MFDRREFLKISAMSATAGLVGCASNRAISPWTGTGPVKSLLLHLGHNMWCDWYPEGFDFARLEEKRRRNLPDTELRSKDPLWRQVTDHAAAKGVNMIVVDLGEGLVYPSHPELAIKGSWSPDKMRDEVLRLRGMGIEAIPKLNFSTTHNGWLKHYRRMLSTPTYYRVCEDLIADIAEIFGHPRFMHIGFDEETAHHQDNDSRTLLITVRKGEFWWHDFLHIVKTVEKNGMRPWAWSDFGWNNPDYYTRCPKSVVQSNWYYDESYGGFDLATNKTGDHKRLKAFWDLEKTGYDQIPCGTNWVGWKRKAVKAGADDVIGKVVELGRKVIGKDRLLGFMMAPWASCDSEENVEKNLKGVDLFADAFANCRS